MELSHLIAFNLLLGAALISPGPAMLVALRGTLLNGRRFGVTVGLGLGFMAGVWTGLALLGLAAVLAVVPWAYLLLKTAGAIYLIWLAFGMWRAAPNELKQDAGDAGLERAFISGIFVNLANPKSVLFAASVLIVVFPPDLSLGTKALIVANQMVVEWIAYGLFAMLLSTPPARAGYLRLKPLFDRIAAAILGTLGLKLLLDR